MWVLARSPGYAGPMPFYRLSARRERAEQAMTTGASRRVRREFEEFQNGVYGIPFETLAGFAEPLYELYGADRPIGSNGQPQEVDLELHVTVLRTARLLWGFFVSSGTSDPALCHRVERLLVGPETDATQRAAFAVLLERLSNAWDRMPPSVRSGQGGKDAADLLAEYLSGMNHHDASELATETVGSAGAAVESPEALASFASPLLDDPAVADDPDALSERMSRAQEYWDLALREGQDFEKRLREILDAHAKDQDERAAILAEAHFMVARFHKLFPFWNRG